MRHTQKRNDLCSGLFLIYFSMWFFTKNLTKFSFNFATAGGDQSTAFIWYAIMGKYRLALTVWWPKFWIRSDRFHNRLGALLGWYFLFDFQSPPGIDCIITRSISKKQHFSSIHLLVWPYAWDLLNIISLINYQSCSYDWPTYWLSVDPCLCDGFIPSLLRVSYFK